MSILYEEAWKLLTYLQLRTNPKFSQIWNQSFSNEIVRLCQGIGVRKSGTGERVSGTNNFHVICYENITPDIHKKIIYTSVLCEVCTQKSETNCTRIIIGDN